MKNKDTMPTIIKHINQTEGAFNPGDIKLSKMQIPESVKEIPVYLSELLDEPDEKTVVTAKENI